MADSGQRCFFFSEPFFFPDTTYKIALLSTTVTNLQKQNQQTCDALSGKLGNEGNYCSGK